MDDSFVASDLTLNVDSESALLAFKTKHILREKNGIVLKETADCLLDGIAEINDLNVAIIRLELLCDILCIPLSNAYGIHASNVFAQLNMVLRKVYRAAGYEYAIRKKSGGVPKINKSKLAVDKEDSDPVWDANDDDNGQLSQSQSESQPSATGCTTNDILPRCQVLCDLLDAIIKLSDNNSGKASETMTKIDTCLDSLVGILCIQLYLPDFASACQKATSFLVRICSGNPALMLALCNALLPILLCKNCKDKLPSSTKFTANAHRMSMKLIISIVTDTTSSLNLISANLSTGNDEEEEDNDEKPLKPKEAKVSTIIIGVLQRLILLTPDRAECRSLAAESICSIMEALNRLDHKEGARVVGKMILKFIVSSKTSHRLLCTDTASQIVLSGWIWEHQLISVDGKVSEEDIGTAVCIAVSSRCNDISAQIRLRALVALHNIIESLSVSSILAFRLVVPYLIERVTEVNDCSDCLLDVILERCNDEKPLVRAKALATLDTYLIKDWANLHPSFRAVFDDETIQVFASACSDKCVSVRKQALVSLSNLLLNRPADYFLIEVFIQNCLPLIYDQESSIQAKVTEFLFHVLFEGATLWSLTSPDPAAHLVWRFCMAVYTSGKSQLLRTVIRHILKSKLINSSNMLEGYTTSIQNACVSESVQKESLAAVDISTINCGGWILLEAIVCEAPTDVVCIDAVVRFTMQVWEENTDSTDIQNCLALNILRKGSQYITSLEQQHVLTQLLQDLLSFRKEPDYIAAALSLLFSFDQAACGREGCPFGNILATCGQLLERAEDCLHRYITGSGVSSDLHGSLLDTSEICSLIFTVGAVAMIGFSVDEDESRFHANRTHATSLSYSSSEDSKYFKINMPQELSSLIKLLLTTKLPRINSDQLIPHSIRAHAFLCMGKLCVREKHVAKETLTIYLRELNTTEYDDVGLDNESVRSNALFVLGDICIRHTSIVDRYVSSFAACLQDSSLAVKKNAVIILSQLVLQDYIKWKGTFLFRFLACTADDNEEFAAFVKTLIHTSIRIKFSDLYTTHICEAILLFNGCPDHNALHHLLVSDGEAALSEVSSLSMSGAKHRKRRYKIYYTMTEELEEEEKIFVAAKLLNDIIADFIDNSAANSTHLGSSRGLSAIESALEDAFYLLQSPELKVGRVSTDADENFDEDAQSSSLEVERKGAVAKAKAKILKKLSVQHLVKHILPVVMTLKCLLQQYRSPVQRSVMLYLVYLRKTHKAEVSEALAEDPVLEKELEFELRMFNKAEEEQKQLLQTKDNENNVQLESNLAIKTPISKLGGVPSTHITSFAKGIQTPVLKNSTNKVDSAVLLSRFKEVSLNSPFLKRLKSDKVSNSPLRFSAEKSDDIPTAFDGGQENEAGKRKRNLIKNAR